MRNFLYFSISFVTALFFVMLGVIGLMIPWSSKVRGDIVQFILEDSFLIFLFGFGLVLIGIAIVVYVVISMKRQYFVIKSKNYSVIVNESVIQDYLETYWKELFPENDVPNQVVFVKNKIHITADLPYISFENQESLLKRIENDLAEIFLRLLGYREEYLISISFQEEPS